MLLGYWGIADDQATIRAASALPATEALSAGFLRTYLRGRGLEAFLLEATLTDLERELAAGHPVLVGVVLRGLTDGVAHYQLVIGLNRSRRRVGVLDPASGLLEDSYQGFSAEWAGSRSLALVARRK
jgi:hypothetical protein